VDDQPAVERPRALRQIAAIDLGKIRPATILSDRPVFDWVDPRELLVDESYQRNISTRSCELIEKIISAWDWCRFKPPVVAATPDGFEVIDGQHTAIAAASHPDISMIPVMIVVARDQAGRASAFIGHNHDRVSITRLQMHRAAVTAGQADAHTLQRVCKRANIVLLPAQPPRGKYSAGETIAVGAIQKLIERRGPNGASRVLEILSAAGLAPVNAASVRAVELLLYDEEFAGKMDADEIRQALAVHAEGRANEAKLFAATHQVPYWKALGIVVFKRKSRKTLAQTSRDRDLLETTALVGNKSESSPEPSGSRDTGRREQEQVMESV